MLRLVPVILLATGGTAGAQPFAEASTSESLSETLSVRSSSAEAESAPVRPTVPPARTRATPSDAPEIEGATPPADRLHVSVDLTITSQYFFRGIAQETEGFIFQPSLEISADLVESDR